MDHEKHQYYFEKYLRNEMSSNGKLTFEEKLSADPELKSSFDHYTANRAEYLSNLAVEHVKRNQNYRLNNWIYLLITSIGLLLSLNFYLEYREMKNNPPGVPVEHVPFYKRIPFLFGFSGDKKKAPTTAPVLKDSSHKASATDTTRAPEPAKSIPFDKDILVIDSLIPAYDKGAFDQQFEFAWAQQDSSANDSILERQTIAAIEQYNRESKSLVPVEFWISPTGYFGYKYNGKKLLLFGYPAPYKITLIRDEKALLIRQDEGNLFPLINDNNFHQF